MATHSKQPFGVWYILLYCCQWWWILCIKNNVTLYILRRYHYWVEINTCLLMINFQSKNYHNYENKPMSMKLHFSAETEELGLGRRLENNFWSFVNKNKWRIESSHVFLTLLLLLWLATESMFLSTFSITGLRNESEAANKTASNFLNMPTLLITCLGCTSAHVQTLKWTWQQSFEGRNVAQQMNEGSNLLIFFPALTCVITMT